MQYFFINFFNQEHSYSTFFEKISQKQRLASEILTLSQLGDNFKITYQDDDNEIITVNTNKILTSKIKHCFSHLDHRSYVSAAKQY